MRLINPDPPRALWDDPARFVEGGRTFMLYAVAGEQGIALAELRRTSH